MKVLSQTMFLLMNKNVKWTARDLPALTEHKQLENVATAYRLHIVESQFK